RADAVTIHRDLHMVMSMPSDDETMQGFLQPDCLTDHYPRSTISGMPGGRRRCKVG
ncbi:unnamed protein product, partial [Musa hybrid cultivar]